MKDRVALAMIGQPEADGRLNAGDTVVDYTGGSTGTPGAHQIEGIGISAPTFSGGTCRALPRFSCGARPA